jgi:hypothetical protein
MSWLGQYNIWIGFLTAKWREFIPDYRTINNPRDNTYNTLNTKPAVQSEALIVHGGEFHNIYF